MPGQLGLRMDEKSVGQKLGDLVDWFLLDRGVTLEFHHNPKHSGKLIPEYDHVFRWQGRRITERGLAMAMNAEFWSRDYRYSLPAVISTLTAKVWDHYLTSFAPPEWVLAASRPLPEKRPVGRPRKHPEPIDIPQPNERALREAVNMAGETHG